MSNTPEVKTMKKRAVFIGRWAPFHKGHLHIMQSKIDQGIPLLILVRDTPDDVYPVDVRINMINTCMKELNVDAVVMVIPDIESVNYGRGVGYEVNEIHSDPEIESISATNIRESISNNDDSWSEQLAPGAEEIINKFKDQGVSI